VGIERIFVILASRFDWGAARLADRWAKQGARLMTPEDLSRSGWRDYLPTSKTARSTAVLGGQEVSFDEIEGVIVRLPWVMENELSHIAHVDRSYVASEMSSYLVCWLSGLKCPVLNRPSATCLSGPGWRAEQWLHAAMKLGIPVKMARRSSMTPETSRVPEDGPVEMITVVGDSTHGQASKEDAQHALKLARYAGVYLMSAVFCRSVLVNATGWASLESDEISTSVLEYLVRRPLTSSSFGAALS
jgi:hypothetical protein